MVRFKNRWLLLSVTALPNSSKFQEGREDEERNQPDLPRPEHVPPSLTAPMILRELRTALETYFGDAGAGTAGGSLAIRYFNHKTGTAILRCARENARLVWASLAMITYVDTVRCRILCKHLSGTIKKAQIHAIDQDRVQIYRLRKLEQIQQQKASKRSATALDAIFSSNPSRSGTPTNEFNSTKRKWAEEEKDEELQKRLDLSKRQILSLST